MKARGAFVVVKFKNPKRSRAYRVAGTKMDGSRVRENYQTEVEALVRKQELEVEAGNFIPDKRITTTRLTVEQEADAERAFAELKKGKSIMAAVRFFNENYREPVIQISLTKALDDFIAERTRANNRPLTIRNLKQRVGNIADHQPDKLLSDVTDVEVQGVICRDGLGLVAQNNERRALLQFFNWATRKGYCAANPVAGIEPIKIDGDDPQILPFEKVRALIATAASFKDGVVLPYVALGLFAGIRPTELSRLSWSNINLKSGTITISDKIAKKRERRVIEMARITERDKQGNETKLPPNLVQWLLPHSVKKTPIVGKNWRRDFDTVKDMVGFGNPELKVRKLKPRKGETEEQRVERLAEQERREKRQKSLKPWVQDYMRHTAISHHLAMFKHEGQTAVWAGNSPDMIQKHYRALVEPEDALEFWSITPAPEGNIVQLPKAAAQP